jgi:hypothetical protein
MMKKIYIKISNNNCIVFFGLRRQLRRFDEPARPLCALVAFVGK